MAKARPIASIYKPHMPMANGADSSMTAAEEVLAYLLIEVIGVPDDVGYSPIQASEIIEDKLLAGKLHEEATLEVIDPTLERLHKFAEHVGVFKTTRYSTNMGKLFASEYEACGDAILGVRAQLALVVMTISSQDPDRMIQHFTLIKEWNAICAEYNALRLADSAIDPEDDDIDIDDYPIDE